MRDLDIRAALRREMQAVHAGDPDTRVLEELSLCLGTARVDVAVVNGSVHGYEIKSAHDTLARLSGQSEVYSRALDQVTLITAEHHALKATRLVPDWWGVLVAVHVPSNGCEFVVERQPTPNPSLDAFAVAQMLWRDEAFLALETRGLSNGLRSKPRRALWARLAESLSIDELRQVVRESIKRRPQEWLAGGSPASGGDSCPPCATSLHCQAH